MSLQSAFSRRSFCSQVACCPSCKNWSSSLAHVMADRWIMMDHDATRDIELKDFERNFKGGPCDPCLLLMVFIWAHNASFGPTRCKGSRTVLRNMVAMPVLYEPSLHFLHPKTCRRDMHSGQARKVEKYRT